MSVETKEHLREKIEQSRRRQQQTIDPAATENLKADIEELERRLLLKMAAGPSGNTAPV